MKKSNKVQYVSDSTITFQEYEIPEGGKLACYTGPMWNNAKAGGRWHAWPADEEGRQAHGRGGDGYSTSYGARQALRALNK